MLWPSRAQMTKAICHKHDRAVLEMRQVKCSMRKCLSCVVLFMVLCGRIHYLRVLRHCQQGTSSQNPRPGSVWACICIKICRLANFGCRQVVDVPIPVQMRKTWFCHCFPHPLQDLESKMERDFETHVLACSMYLLGSWLTVFARVAAYFPVISTLLDIRTSRSRVVQIPSSKKDTSSAVTGFLDTVKTDNPKDNY